MVRIFILEDSKERIDWFKENLLTNNIDITEDVDVARELLNSFDYDIIFLDHDLGGRVYVDSKEYNTGATVSKFIHETRNKNVNVIIHSWNENGSKIMSGYLTASKVRSFYAPFGSGEFKNFVKQVNNVIENRGKSK